MWSSAYTQPDVQHAQIHQNIFGQYGQPQVAPQIVNNIYNSQSFVAPAPYGDKSIVVAYTLWLFLGFFGAHRFYLRLNVGGVLQLLTCGGAGMWWLLDAALSPGMVRSANR